LNEWFKRKFECPFCKNKKEIKWKKDIEFEEKVIKIMDEINNKIYDNQKRDNNNKPIIKIKKHDLFDDLNNGKYKCKFCRNSRCIYKNWKNHALYHRDELKKLYKFNILFGE
jgi:glutaredoxin